MVNCNVEAVFLAQVLRELLGQIYRAVLPAGAAE
jgi:hypothetical protein